MMKIMARTWNARDDKKVPELPVSQVVIKEKEPKKEKK